MPALLGLIWSFGSLRRLPGFWALALYCTMHAGILLALALTVSYVSDRHVMVLVLCGSFLASRRTVGIAARVLRAAGPNPRSLLMHPTCWSLLLLAGLIGFCLPKTLQPLHTNRLGNREAGLWLAAQLRPGDIVDDDHCWSHYYAGEVFREDQHPPPRTSQQPTYYVVITRAHQRAIGTARRQREAQLEDEGAHIVYRWPATGKSEDALVVVYARPCTRNDHEHLMPHQVPPLVPRED